MKISEFAEKAENQIKEHMVLHAANLTDIIKITNMEFKVKDQYSTTNGFTLEVQN